MLQAARAQLELQFERLPLLLKRRRRLLCLDQGVAKLAATRLARCLRRAMLSAARHEIGAIVRRAVPLRSLRALNGAQGDELGAELFRRGGALSQHARALRAALIRSRQLALRVR